MTNGSIHLDREWDSPISNRSKRLHLTSNGSFHFKGVFNVPFKAMSIMNWSQQSQAYEPIDILF